MLGRGAARVVRLYQLTVGRLFPSRCRYAPSCSAFAIEALRQNGLIVGSIQTAGRLLRCAPWGRGGYDPVRPRRRMTEAKRG